MNIGQAFPRTLIVWSPLFLLFSGISVFSLIRLYVLGPNTYEQGYMYTAAVAFENGKMPHRDFFMQYGPVTPMLQGSWMKLFGSHLVQLQYVTVFSLILTATLLFFVLKERFGSSWSVFLTLAWLFTGPHGNPWSSVWANYFALFGVYLLSKLSVKHHSFLFRFVIPLTANSFFMLAFFSRVHLLSVIFSVTIWILFFADKTFPRLQFFFSLFLVSMVFIVTFWHLGILSPWYEQCISWPLDFYLGKGPGLTLARVGDFLFIPGLTFIGLLFVFLVIQTQYAITLKNHLVAKLALYILLITPPVIVVLLQNMTVTPPYTLSNTSVFLNTFSFKAPYVFTFAVITIYFILFTYKLFNLVSKRINAFSLYDALAVGLLTQLYPLHDPYHIFVVVPGLLCAISRLNLRYLHNFQFDWIVNFRRSVRLASSWLILVLLLQNLYLGLNVDYRFSKGILTGIYSRSYESSQLEGRMSRSWALQIEKTINLLSQTKLDGQIRFECKEGLFSAASGKYMADDPYFVNWGPSPNQRNLPRYTFYCALSKKEFDDILSKDVNLVFVSRFTSSPTSSMGTLYYALINMRTSDKK